MFRVESTLHIEAKGRGTQVSCEFNLEVSKNLQKDKYISDEHIPTLEGSVVVSNVLVQALVSNIHYAHQAGFRDSAEHLRDIIAKLEEGFIQVTEVKKTSFTKFN